MTVRDGVRVILPARMAAAEAEPLLRARAAWVLRTLDRAERWARVMPVRRLAHGAEVPFLGTNLRLDVARGPTRVGRLGDSLMVTVPTPVDRSIRRALVGWYRREAEWELERRVRDLSSRHGLAVRSVVVRDQKTRWGSCSTSGRLSFNWRLMLAPPEIVDYLVCHELAHLWEPNHSPRFWARVGGLCPAWREREKWLRKHGAGLVL
ncbi:MAG: M48 family metallopeptidase [Planctomycetes bacterium]|nr:M48 family metallopeptidase [Planctomycetota bacterium]